MKFSKRFYMGHCNRSAYQIEGAYNRDGKGVSIWDTFCHTPGKINDNRRLGDIACDHYDKYEDDIKLMAELGIVHTDFQYHGQGFFLEGDDEIPNAKGPQFGSQKFSNKVVQNLNNLFSCDYFFSKIIGLII